MLPIFEEDHLQTIRYFTPNAQVKPYDEFIITWLAQTEMTTIVKYSKIRDSWRLTVTHSCSDVYARHQGFSCRALSVHLCM